MIIVSCYFFTLITSATITAVAAAAAVAVAVAAATTSIVAVRYSGESAVFILTTLAVIVQNLRTSSSSDDQVNGG